MTKLRVSLHSIGPAVNDVSVEDLYSGLSELPGSQVVWDVSGYEPPAAGFSEISNVVSFLADSKELLLPAATWIAGKYGGAASGKFRDVLSQCRRSRESGRPYVPMMIGFGTNPDFPSVRFFFHREVDAEELRAQLKGMIEVLESIPEEAFYSSPGPTENGFFWDHQEKRWRENYALRPMIPDNDEEPWFPEKVFDDWGSH